MLATPWRIYTCRLFPANIDKSIPVSIDTYCQMITWRYLEQMEKRNAIPRVQAEYWDILVENGLVIQ